jgi:hypothetical protein
MTATLLPNAKQQFLDGNGKPLAGGSVFFYIPNTSTFKSTWQDAAQTILNTNPVILDASGEAVIWGSGVYRQVVYDVDGNLIWDQITQDANSNLTGNITDDVFIAGTDFTPGTTTQLTLSVGPGSIDNTWIFFDGVYQADDQAGVENTTLTFNSPIPIGITEVTVKIGSTIAIGTPASGSVTDITVAPNANIQSTKLSFIQAGNGAVRRTVQDKLRERVTVKDFGAKGDGTTDDTAAITAAQAFIAANAQAYQLVFTAGMYKYTTSPNWAIQNAEIVAEGEVILDYTGTGNAVILDTGSTVNTFTYNVTFTGFIVQAPASAGHGFFVRSIHHSDLRNNRVQGCGTSSNAFEVEFAVCTDFSGCTASANETLGWVGGQPKNGLHLALRNAGESTSYCYFANTVWEGLSTGGGAGILLEDTLGNIFIGGTAEGCDSGIILGTTATWNRFFGVDMEANATRDVFDQGLGNSFNVDTATRVTISASALFSTWLGGNHQVIELPTGVRHPTFSNVYVNRTPGGGFLIGDDVDVCNARFNGCRDWQTQVIVPMRQKTLTPPAGPNTFNYTNNTDNDQQITLSGATVTSTSLTRGGVANSLGLTIGIFPLSPGDSFSVAYSAGTPSIVLYTK